MSTKDVLSKYNVEDYSDISNEGLLESAYETSEAIHSINSALNDIDAAMDLTDSVLSIESMLAMHDLSDREIELVNGNLKTLLLAHAGEIENLGLESGGVAVAQKVILAVLKGTYELIKEMLVQLFQALKKFIQRMRYNLKGVRKSNNDMLETMRENSKKGLKVTKVDIEGTANSLSIDYKTPQNGEEIYKGLQTLSRYANAYFKLFDKDVISSSSKLISAVERFDIANPELSLKAVLDIADTINPNTAADLVKSTVDKNVKMLGGGLYKKSLPLMGNRSIMYFEPYIEPSEVDLIAVSRIKRTRWANLKATRDNPPKGSSSTEIDVITVSQAAEIHRLVRDLTHMVEDHLDNRDKILKLERSINRALDKMKSRSESSSDISEKGKRHYQEVMRYSQRYIFWAQNPQMELVKLILSSCRSAIVACNKSAAVYG
ncbi:MAG: hypothetical protein IBX57_00380 [Gammaproteobacteria bacterium]|nr:hypothetical protein [Gammaproteobacteria bacterium]